MSDSSSSDHPLSDPSSHAHSHLVDRAFASEAGERGGIKRVRESEDTLDAVVDALAMFKDDVVAEFTLLRGATEELRGAIEHLKQETTAEFARQRQATEDLRRETVRVFQKLLGDSSD